MNKWLKRLLESPEWLTGQNEGFTVTDTPILEVVAFGIIVLQCNGHTHTYTFCESAHDQFTECILASEGKPVLYAHWGNERVL